MKTVHKSQLTEMFAKGSWKRPVLALAAVASLFVAGCYWARLTGNYDDVFEVNNVEDDSAILEETGREEETLARIRKRLQELADEKEPVYLMNAGDQIEIRVYGHPDLGMVTKIGPDGTVGIAFLGQIRLSGQTISEGTELIRKGLAPYVKNPVVSITVKEIASETATITGACAKPGVYGISNHTRLGDLYAIAGSSSIRLFNGVHGQDACLSTDIPPHMDRLVRFGYANGACRQVSGRIMKADSPEDARPLAGHLKSPVLVLRRITADYIPILRVVNAVISETGSDLSAGDLKDINKDLVWVTDAPDVLTTLENNLSVTVDGEQGLVYEGTI